MSKVIAMMFALVIIAGCATGYNPNNARPRAQDMGHPEMYCPAGSVVVCEIEGGAIVGKRYGYCQCQS